jgi:hypothetical protein
VLFGIIFATLLRETICFKYGNKTSVQSQKYGVGGPLPVDESGDFHFIILLVHHNMSVMAIYKYRGRQDTKFRRFVAAICCSLDIINSKKKMDMRFGTWNVRSMYRAGSLRAVEEEISKYKLDGTEVALNQQANIRFSMEKGMKIMI